MAMDVAMVAVYIPAIVHTAMEDTGFPGFF